MRTLESPIVDVPLGVSIDTSFVAAATTQVSIAGEAGLSCEIPNLPSLHKPFTAGPVPMLLVMEPEVSASLLADTEISEQGVTVTAGFGGAAYLPLPGIGGEASMSSEPIFSAVADLPSGERGGKFTVQGGGSIAIGPGVGTEDIGVQVGLKGSVYPLKVEGEVTRKNDGTPPCYTLSVGHEATADIFAAVWVPAIELEAKYEFANFSGTWQPVLADPEGCDDDGRDDGGDGDGDQVPVNPQIVPGQPWLTGAARVGGTLTANPGGWQPAAVQLSFQWMRDGQDIPGETGETYSVVAEDDGKRLNVRVTGSLEGYASKSLVSNAARIGQDNLAGTRLTQVISAGVNHRLARDSAGRSRAWGPGDSGLGLYGDGLSLHGITQTPVVALMPDGVSFVEVSAGWDHSLALGSDGKAYAWGSNEYGRLGNGSDVGSSIRPGRDA